MDVVIVSTTKKPVIFEATRAKKTVTRTDASFPMYIFR